MTGVQTCALPISPDLLQPLLLARAAAVRLRAAPDAPVGPRCPGSHPAAKKEKERGSGCRLEKEREKKQEGWTRPEKSQKAGSPKKRSCVRQLKAGWEKREKWPGAQPAVRKVRPGPQPADCKKKICRLNMGPAAKRKERASRLAEKVARCGEKRNVPVWLPAVGGQREKRRKKIVARWRKVRPDAHLTALRKKRPTVDSRQKRRRQSSCREIRPDCSAVGPNLGGYT